MFNDADKEALQDETRIQAKEMIDEVAASKEFDAKLKAEAEKMDSEINQMRITEQKLLDADDSLRQKMQILREQVAGLQRVNSALTHERNKAEKDLEKYREKAIALEGAYARYTEGRISDAEMILAIKKYCDDPSVRFMTPPFPGTICGTDWGMR